MRHSRLARGPANSSNVTTPGQFDWEVGRYWHADLTDEVQQLVEGLHCQGLQLPDTVVFNGRCVIKQEWQDSNKSEKMGRFARCFEGSTAQAL